MHAHASGLLERVSNPLWEINELFVWRIADVEVGVTDFHVSGRRMHGHDYNECQDHDHHYDDCRCVRACFHSFLLLSALGVSEAFGRLRPVDLLGGLLLVRKKSTDEDSGKQQSDCPQPQDTFLF